MRKVAVLVFNNLPVTALVRGKMRQNQSLKPLVIAALLCVLIINISTVLSIASLSSMAFLVSIAVTFIFFVVYILSVHKVSALLFFSLIVPVMCVVINNFSFNFDYYRKLLLYIVAVLYFWLLLYVPIDEKILRRGKLTTFCLAILYIVGYFLLNIRTTMAGGITLNFTNPNFTAMWLLSTSLLMIIYGIGASNIIEKGVCFLFSAILAYLMYLTLARATMISFVFFMGLIVLSSVWGRNGFPKTILLLIVLLPLLGGLIYLVMCSNNTIQNVLYFLEGEGKTLTSRYWIWTYALDVFKSSILVGDYYTATGGTGLSQMHNTHFDILASYGLISFSLFVAVIYRLVVKLQFETKSFQQKLAFFGFLSILFSGLFEGALFAGSMGLNYLVGNFIILARSQPQNTHSRRLDK